MNKLWLWLCSLDWHKRIMELAALATVATVGFAAVQIIEDREVRLIEARLKAIELIVPRFSFGLASQLDWFRSVEDFDDFDRVAVDVRLEAFNESGLAFKIAAYGQRCIEDLDPNYSGKLPVDVGIWVKDHYPPLEGPVVHRISKGPSDLALTLNLRPSDLSASNVHVTILFYDISVPESVLETVGDAFSSYDDELILSGTTDEFTFDMVFTKDTDEETISVINCELDDQTDFNDWKVRLQSGEI